jgi:hypothetical protein
VGCFGGMTVDQHSPTNRLAEFVQQFERRADAGALGHDVGGGVGVVVVVGNDQQLEASADVDVAVAHGKFSAWCGVRLVKRVDLDW